MISLVVEPSCAIARIPNCLQEQLAISAALMSLEFQWFLAEVRACCEQSCRGVTSAAASYRTLGLTSRCPELASDADLLGRGTATSLFKRAHASSC